MKVKGTRDHPGDEVTSLFLMEAGERTAFLCIGDEVLAERVARILQSLNYHVVNAQDLHFARDMLEFTSGNLILLDEEFGGVEVSESPLRLYLQELDMPVRRRLFFCLLAEETPTLDAMAAFCAGVNVIINVQDVERMPAILERAIKDHWTFYSPFIDEFGRRENSPA